MFSNLTAKEKESKFSQLLGYANKIANKKLKNACIRILNDYKPTYFAEVRDTTALKAFMQE